MIYEKDATRLEIEFELYVAVDARVVSINGRKVDGDPDAFDSIGAQLLHVKTRNLDAVAEELIQLGFTPAKVRRVVGAAKKWAERSWRDANYWEEWRKKRATAPQRRIVHRCKRR